MEKMGNKATARDLMTKAGLPLLPGTIEPVATADEAQDVADEIGYPVIIKAAAGGGGRGMTVISRRGDLRAGYSTTRAQAQAVFKDSAVYIERYLQAPRHIEIQVLCDTYGAGIHLGERDCSVQRRHQKLIEEAPSIHLTAELRAAMGSAAVEGAVGRLQRRGDDGVPARRRRPVLVHGDERAHPGRAPRHRDGVGRRPHPGAAAGRAR